MPAHATLCPHIFYFLYVIIFFGAVFFNNYLQRKKMNAIRNVSDVCPFVFCSLSSILALL